MAEAESGAPELPERDLPQAGPLEDGPADGRTEDAEAASSDPASAVTGPALPARPPTPDTSWLEELERRVHDAAERLRELTAGNARLEKRVAELEAALERAEADRAEAAEAAPARGEEGEAAGADAWRRERREIRRRVESLTETLESLLSR